MSEFLKWIGIVLIFGFMLFLFLAYIVAFGGVA